MLFAGVKLSIVIRRDAIRTLPDDSSREQSDHANDGQDDVTFRPKHQLRSSAALSST